MNNLSLTPVFIKDIQLISKSELHFPSKKSLDEYRSLSTGPSLKLTLYRWDSELYYVDHFYEVALQKQSDNETVKKIAYAEIIDATTRDEIVYATLRNSYTNKVGIQKLNQFRFELVLELSNQSVEEIKKNTGLKEKHIREFSFHKDMSRAGRRHAENKRDLTLMNKIWSSPTLTKSDHIRPYLESMRIDGKLNTSQFHFIEKYVRSAINPFNKRKNVYENQIFYLLSQKEVRQQILFKEVEHIGLFGKPPSVA